MAAPTYRSNSAFAGAAKTNADIIQVNRPAGMLATDGLVVFLMLESSENPVVGFSAPPEMTLELGTFASLGGFDGHIFCYSLRGNTWTGDFTWTNSTWREVYMAAFSGITDSGDFTDIVTDGTAVNGTSINWSGTTTKNETTLVFCAKQANGGSWTGPGNERYDGTSANEIAGYDDAGPVEAGATGTKTFTSVGSGLMQVIGAAIYGAQLQFLRPDADVEYGGWALG